MEKTTDLSDRYPDAGILPFELRNFGKSVQFSGPAVTVKCFEDNSRIKELSQTPGNGKVLVVDGGGSTRCALFGDIIAIDLQKNGWAGAVIFGCVRDAAVLASVPLGIKALGSHPRKTIKQNEGQVGGRIVIGGVAINAGDQIHADEDGVVVLPAISGT